MQEIHHNKFQEDYLEGIHESRLCCGQAALCKFVGRIVSGNDAEIISFHYVRRVCDAYRKRFSFFDILYRKTVA